MFVECDDATTELQANSQDCGLLWGDWASNIIRNMTLIVLRCARPDTLLQSMGLPMHTWINQITMSTHAYHLGVSPSLYLSFLLPPHVHLYLPCSIFNSSVSTSKFIPRASVYAKDNVQKVAVRRGEGN